MAHTSAAPKVLRVRGGEVRSRSDEESLRSSWWSQGASRPSDTNAESGGNATQTMSAFSAADPDVLWDVGVGTGVSAVDPVVVYPVPAASAGRRFIRRWRWR